MVGSEVMVGKEEGGDVAVEIAGNRGVKESRRWWDKFRSCT